MSDPKFTPGDWHWNEDKWNGGWSGLYSDNDTPVLVPQSCNDGDDGAAWFATVEEADEEGLADADRALIAAAPELYEALQGTVRILDALLSEGFTGYVEDSRKVKAALAKARGEQKQEKSQ
jgi:hypothetical protein